MKTLLFIVLLASGCGSRTQEAATFCQEMILPVDFEEHVCPHKEHRIEIVSSVYRWSGRQNVYICRCGEKPKDAGR
jgi:predicted amidophosphoribosyltransferase